MDVYKRQNVISLAEQKAYWQKQLCGELPVLEIPSNYLTPIQSFTRAKETIELEEQCLELQKFCVHENVTLFITLLATFKVLLLRYTGQEDIIVGSMSVDSMRKSEQAGWEEFANPVALRTNLISPLNAKELLMRVSRTVVGAVENRDYPFEALVEDINGEYLTTPIFQVMLILCNVPFCISETPISEVELANIEERSAKYDVVFLVFEEGGGLKINCEYDAELFEPALIRRMLRHFQTLLSSIVANPDQCISTLSLLTEAERHQLLVEWNDTKAEYPQSKCIHQLFEAQVERTPDAVAVVFEQQLTYQELNTKANQLAHYLQASGVGSEVLVGICTERSLEMIVGLLGILKAGGAYVPLDPTYPFGSLSFILEDVRPSVLLTQKRLVEGLPPQWGAKVICLDSDWEAIAQESAENLVSKVTVENLAYVIYTSGSTGMPKGVMIAHRGLCNREPEFKLYHVQPDSRVLQFASLSFDTSVSEIFMTLLAGAVLYLEAQDSLLLGPALMNVLRNKGITTLTLPPSVLATLPVEEFPALQTLIAAGEACTANLVATWGPGRRFLNAYGPTEVTVCATVAECVDDNHKPSIGRPVPNKQVYLLDQHFQLVPLGVPGELYIGGVGLARGYLNRPELTAEKFIPNPFSQKPGARLYKTGDLACYLTDGKIEFLGRIDHQVKLRGFRIELGEIEAVLVQHTGVRETVVITRDYAPGDKRLVAYVIPYQEQVPTTSELRRFLKQKLPDYMIPSAFLLLDALPLTPNGKVDRRALPAPDQARPDQERAFVAPQDSLELQLTKIWEQILSIQPIGVQDNFFELGGNSLLAVRLFAQIQEVFGKALPLATFFQAPTIKQLADVLRCERFSAPIQSLVALKSGGTKPPLFCIRGILHYQDLARHLAPEQPVYGVYLQDEVELLLAGRLKAQLSALTNVAELATQYLKEIQTLQPVGPYFIAGESFGGLVAFEMAQHLYVQGEKVAMLALFDTEAPGCEKKLPWRQRFSLHLGNLLREGSAYALKKAKRNLDKSQGRLASTISKIQRQFNHLRGPRWPGYLQQAQFDIRDQVVIQARANYLPRPYPGKVILFRALERDKFDPYYTDPQLGWGELPIGEFEVHHVPGDHLNMLREPHVRVLAEKLTACLDKAQANM